MPGFLLNLAVIVSFGLFRMVSGHSSLALCEEYCQEIRVATTGNMFQPKCECFENTRESFTSLWMFNCEVCSVDGEICVVTTIERNLLNELSCYRFTKGHDGDHFCEELVYHPTEEDFMGFPVVTSRSLTYNDNPCTSGEATNEFVCDGVMISTAKPGGVYSDAIQMSAFGFMQRDNEVQPGACGMSAAPHTLGVVSTEEVPDEIDESKADDSATTGEAQPEQQKDTKEIDESKADDSATAGEAQPEQQKDTKEINSEATTFIGVRMDAVTAAVTGLLLILE